jgi:membrane protease YdiL (CAAX protease family)
VGPKVTTANAHPANNSARLPHLPVSGQAPPWLLLDLRQPARESGPVQQGGFAMIVEASDVRPGRAGTGPLLRYPLTSFFILAYAGSWLVWALFMFSRDGAGVLPFHSPLDFLETVAIGIFLGPALAAVIVTGVTEGKAGLRRFLGRIVLWRVGVKWYLFVLLGIPALVSLGTLVLPGVWGSFQPMENPIMELISYPPFFVYPALLIGGPLGEEPGWRGFTLPRLQERHGPLLGSLILGPLWACWHTPIWFSGQWTEPALLNIGLYIVWISAMTVIMTWVFNRTRGSVFLAILAHTSMDAFPNAILWPLFPAATKLTDYGCLYGYMGCAIGYGAMALLIVVFTRGRLGYQHNRPDDQETRHDGLRPGQAVDDRRDSPPLGRGPKPPA